MAKRSKLKKPKDPHKPKSNPSCFFLYHHEVHPRFKEENPDKKRVEITRLIAAKWKTMSDEEKKPYYDKAAILRNEYMTKMTEYKKTQNYTDYQQKLKQWKQQCIDAENSDSPQNNDNNNTKNKKKRKRKWKEFKNRRQKEHETDSDDDISMKSNNKNKNKNNNDSNESEQDEEKMDKIDKSKRKNKKKDITEWNWYCIIQWLNRIENGRFKHKKYSNIKKLWKESGIKGFELFGLNDLVLRLGGITDKNDREMILKNIIKLTQKNNDDKNDKEIISKISIMECDVPNEMCCPISFEIMENPVLCTVSGHSYEKDMIEEYINEKNEDPLTRQTVTKEQLVPNRALRDMIQSWKSKHIISDA